MTRLLLYFRSIHKKATHTCNLNLPYENKWNKKDITNYDDDSRNSGIVDKLKSSQKIVEIKNVKKNNTYKMKNLPIIRNEKNNKLKLKEVKYNKNSKPNNNDEKLKRVALQVCPIKICLFCFHCFVFIFFAFSIVLFGIFL